ncbi:MAG TPA: AmmeMemoRadiSam system protein A [Candidatus Aminicenantes bacterium]|nr:AmmeMemoRadiSam system protein A [Candidatus Aminicenantes bacterium]
MAELSQEDKRDLLALVRQTIRQRLAGGKRAGAEPPAGRPQLQEKRGVFVTLHRGDELRGCIGYPLPMKPLWEAVREMAAAAAFEDPRFPAVARGELEEIDIEISVLTVPREVAGAAQVRLGSDGIIVSRGPYRGLLLPQVPVEQGWDLEQYISYGCRKAGLPPDEWKRGVRIETFQAVVFGEKRHAEAT